MDKPIIFFSHSSKDKDLIYSIKNKLDAATGGVIDIFMSSDGQSIPFGTNWIHKIEEGLQAARIMFVFITENSISSGWIYFETGYAYSKGIQVIPVGIGVDIGGLKAPLNLLQGFNVSSEDSLNNFITIINRAFDYHFPNVFAHDDYLEVISKVSTESFNISRFEGLIDKIECEIYGVEKDDDKKKEYDLDKFFESVIEHLNSQNISFSREDQYLGDERCSCLVMGGIKMIYRRENKRDDGIIRITDDRAKIKIYVSAYNFLNAFGLLKELLQLLEEREHNYVWLHLKKLYSYIVADEDRSSIMSKHPEFNMDESNVGGYRCNELGLSFYIFDTADIYVKNHIPEMVASVVFDCKDTRAESIVELIEKLYDIGVIVDRD